ncbi:hypothetical protein HG536_0G04390 [Torulaspora globosa]|uniref:Uncharacterized protein n=1 Tax=Torulaspora globosa TaxID=48254 RepID=A0A7G3ZM41_9SACH|nr:uncharacterized protein HG536_0G04390 [Torulaspora globosa]QLL34577.1 hypothetical protein HG536_0G04390 [Torulaspora globosa]
MKDDLEYSINAQTFDNVDPTLFRNFKIGALFNYVVLVWGLTLLKIALFVSDIYTCIKLLAFNSWSNNIIQPYIPFRISKWLFSGCILASIALLVWETVCGIRVYRTRNIALTYVNNFSRTAYSIKDYNTFCVLDKINPSGAYQKISFYTFFELKDCIRLLLADTPRQVINGLTLWSVLVTVKPNARLGDLESFDGLISKIRTIAQTNHEEAVILSFMLFSFVIWAFFISKLVLALIFAVFVYYRLLNEQKYAGLRSFVCATISRNVDALVEERKKKYNDLYNTSVVSLGTFDEFKGQSTNGSSAELLKQQTNFSRTSSQNDDLEAQKEKMGCDFNETTMSLAATSMVDHTDEPTIMDSTAHILSTVSLVRETSPQSITKDHSFERNRICTPVQARTRLPYPQRSDSLWERREKIANEDYGHYIHGNR